MFNELKSFDDEFTINVVEILILSYSIICILLVYKAFHSH